jgi:hypothetical protein
MKFLPPKSATVLNLPNDDCVRIIIGYGLEQNREWMVLGSGATWSLGVPKRALLAFSTQIQERELKPYWTDYSGLDANGKKWRFVGSFSETITYENVSENAAQFFDSIIDGMCWDASAWPKDK